MVFLFTKVTFINPAVQVFISNPAKPVSHSFYNCLSCFCATLHEDVCWKWSRLFCVQRVHKHLLILLCHLLLLFVKMFWHICPDAETASRTGCLVLCFTSVK